MTSTAKLLLAPGRLFLLTMIFVFLVAIVCKISGLTASISVLTWIDESNINYLGFPYFILGISFGVMFGIYSLLENLAKREANRRLSLLHYLLSTLPVIGLAILALYVRITTSLNNHQLLYALMISFYACIIIGQLLLIANIILTIFRRRPAL